MNDKNATPTGLDLLKYVVAVNTVGTSNLIGWVSTSGVILPGARVELMAMLDNLRSQVAAVLAGRGRDLDWYATGFPVHTATTFPDCDCTHFSVWHPIPQHEDNRCQDIAVLNCLGGGRHRLTVMGLGEIETLDLEATGAE